MFSFDRNKITIFALLFTFAFISFSQSEKDKKKKYKTTKLSTDYKTQSSVGGSFTHEHVNDRTFYFDKNELDKIESAENDKDWKKAIHLYEKYISNFGVENYYKNVKMFWKLGQLYELVGEMAKAKEVYKLVLKHHRSEETMIPQHFNNLNVTEVKDHLDKVTANEKDEYVPLKHYYELVEYRKNIDTLRPPKGVLINMGEEINSRYEDYGPAINLAQNMLLFTSKRNLRNRMGEESNEDLFFSTLDEAGIWSEAAAFKELNTHYNEGSVTINADNTVLFFTRCGAPDGYGNCDIYVSKKNEYDKWGVPKNLGPAVNSRGWDSQPSLSHSEDTLFFASDRIGGFGMSDIYYTTKNKDGSWDRCKNLGPILNTRNSEVSPFFHPVHNVLYFSSRGHLLNFGDFDIYKSYLKEGTFQEPISTGPLVNGKGSEYYFTIDADSKNLFYARSEADDIENLDIFSFPLPMEAHPKADTKFEGRLIDSVTSKPFSGIVSIIDLDNGIEVAPKFLRPDGSFSFDLIDHNKYLLIIQGDDFFRIEQVFNLNGDTTFTIKTPSIQFKHLQFTSIVFEANSSEILDGMHADLDKIFNYMIDNPSIKLVISGHTDTDGDHQKNLDLSQQRADAIRDYLLGSSIVDGYRIKSIGYGSTKPLIKNEKSEEDKSTNRRVEFEILRPGDAGYEPE